MKISFQSIALYFNTIRYLKPSQVFYQILRRSVKKRIKEYQFEKENLQKYSLAVRELDEDEEYIQRFRPDEILKNRINLLNHMAEWFPGKWENREMNHLWNFNLHYFEYEIALAVRFRKTANHDYREKLLELITDWIENVKDGDGWHPYTISLRIPNWLIAFEILGEELPEKVINSIYTQYRWLLRNQEKQLLANHYFENLKTIFLCSHLFHEERQYVKYREKIIREIRIQLCEDGVHYERSLMYHRIILEDLIRIARILEQRNDSALALDLEKIQKMSTAMSSLECGMGKMPHFNDAANGVSRSKEQLTKALERLWEIQPDSGKISFPFAGYFKLYIRDMAMIIDCGKPGPEYMCGHAHCDALSFELSRNNRPLLVNAGTYQYQGEKRKFFRSTQAHNTVMIGGEQQSEYWGEHRMARRIRDVRCSCEKNMVKGSYVTYLGNCHQRIFAAENGIVRIEDRIRGPEKQIVSAFFRAHPNLMWKKTAEHSLVLIRKEDNAVVLKLTFDKGNFNIHRNEDICMYSDQFGRLEKAEVLEIQNRIYAGKCNYTVFLIPELTGGKSND